MSDCESIISDDASTVYKAEKKNVRRALEMFEAARTDRKRRASAKDGDNRDKYTQFCNPILNNKEKYMTSAYLPTLVLKEMRLCLMKHDWINLQRLFPILLENSNAKETFVWRYALTILLHSPMSSLAHLHEFLNYCIGCQTDDHSQVLDKLITLRKCDNRSCC